MKLKSTVLGICCLVSVSMSASAATMIISNAANGPSDTLYANNNNSLMTSGLVTMGYFTAGITDSSINTVAKLYSELQLGHFTLVTSQIPGTAGPQVGTGAPGYADQASATTVSGGLVAVGQTNEALLGRTIYSIVTNATIFTVGAGAGQINGGTNFALLNMGQFASDLPVEQGYSSFPSGITPVIGTIGTFNGNPGGIGEGTYSTLIMAIPETSSVLLGALGMLGLLRRRR